LFHLLTSVYIAAYGKNIRLAGFQTRLLPRPG
jgi:hypothetical protein